MNQEKQEDLQPAGVTMGMAWWIFLMSVNAYEQSPDSNKSAYSHCHNPSWTTSNPVLFGYSRDFYRWYKDN